MSASSPAAAPPGLGSAAAGVCTPASSGTRAGACTCARRSLHCAACAAALCCAHPAGPPPRPALRGCQRRTAGRPLRGAAAPARPCRSALRVPRRRPACPRWLPPAAPPAHGGSAGWRHACAHWPANAGSVLLLRYEWVRWHMLLLHSGWAACSQVTQQMRWACEIWQAGECTPPGTCTGARGWPPRPCGAPGWPAGGLCTAGPAAGRPAPRTRAGPQSRASGPAQTATGVSTPWPGTVPLPWAGRPTPVGLQPFRGLVPHLQGVSWARGRARSCDNVQRRLQRPAGSRAPGQSAQAPGAGCCAAWCRPTCCVRLGTLPTRLLSTRSGRPQLQTAAAAWQPSSVWTSSVSRASACTPTACAGAARRVQGLPPWRGTEQPPRPCLSLLCAALALAV